MAEKGYLQGPLVLGFSFGLVGFPSGVAVSADEGAGTDLGDENVDGVLRPRMYLVAETSMVRWEGERVGAEELEGGGGGKSVELFVVFAEAGGEELLLHFLLHGCFGYCGGFGRRWL